MSTLPAKQPESQVKRLGQLVATKLGFRAADSLLPGLGVLAEIGHEAFNANREDAQKAAEQVLLSELAERVGALGDRLEADEIDAQQVQSQLTVLFRVVMEAGRHPEQEMRKALGALAARLMFTDRNMSRKFEIAEVAARLTALDVDFLALLRACELGKVCCYETGHVGRGQLSVVRIPYLWSALSQRGVTLEPEDVEALGLRLEAMQLVMAGLRARDVTEHSRLPSPELFPPSVLRVQERDGTIHTTSLARDLLDELKPLALDQVPPPTWDSEGWHKRTTVLMDGTGRTLHQVEQDETRARQMPLP
ncbi:MAG: hypothetical protein AB7N76_09555 [Planctomycetota bacterium]